MERKGFGQTLFTDAVENRIADVVADGDVRDRDDAVAHHALHSLRRAEPVAHVFDAMAMVFARRLCDGVFISVERHIEGAVADGMDAAAQAGIVAYLHGVVQFILLNANDAVIVLVVFVGIVKARVAAGDAAVDAHFDAADAQPLVAKAGDETELD